ncbi:MAG TPA: PKD domain-containing protein, partial [Thermoplasmatales archaeon]|nr:PKD domain-containing protein [Thermoplasmatales archaeon]
MKERNIDIGKFIWIFFIVSLVTLPINTITIVGNDNLPTGTGVDVEAVSISWEPHIPPNPTIRIIATLRNNGPNSFPASDLDVYIQVDGHGYGPIHSYDPSWDPGEIKDFCANVEVDVGTHYLDVALYDAQTGYLWHDDNDANNEFDPNIEIYVEWDDINHPPNTPSAPSGPGIGLINEDYVFYASTIDPDGDMVKFKFDWGDGQDEWSNYVPSGAQAACTHSWNSPGTYDIYVIAKDARGLDTGLSSPHQITIIQNHPPNIPTNPFPENNSDDVNIDVVLEWDGGDSDTSNTVIYEIYFGTDPDNLPRVHITNPVPAMQTRITYQPDVVSMNTHYYWRIKAIDNFGEETVGPIWNFLTNDNNPPEIPDIPLGPTEGLIGESLTYFTSTDDPDEDMVRFWFNWGDGTEGPWTDFVSPNENASQSHIWVSPGVYEVRVKASDSHDMESNYSPSLILNILKSHFPENLSCVFPLNGSKDVDLNADLIWSGGDPDIGDSVTYKIYFGTNPNPPLFDTIGPYPASTLLIRYDPGLLLQNTHYYWKVDAEDNNGISKEGPVWEFTTMGNNPPSVPDKPAGPLNGIVDRFYAFSSIGVDVDDDWIQYKFDWGDGTQSKWTNFVKSGSSERALKSWNHSGKFYIKAKARDIHGAESDWSDFSIINITENHPPYIPHSENPINNSSNVDIESNLSWTGGDPDGDIVYYDVYFGKENTFKRVSTHQMETSYDPEFLVPDTQYYWQVIAWDEYGIPTLGPIWTFHTAGNNPPQTPNIPCGPIKGLIGETYCYTTSAIDPDGDEIQFEFDWGDHLRTKTPFVGSGVIQSAKHFWNSQWTYQVKVRAIDIHNAKSDWSEPLTVQISKPALSRPKLRTPMDGDRFSDGAMIYFDWKDVIPLEGGINYHLEWTQNPSDKNSQGYYNTGGSWEGQTSQHSEIIPTGTWYWHVIAIDDGGTSSEWSEERVFTVGDVANPDLYISENNISFQSSKKGSTTISATVHNIGNKVALDVDVSFYIGNPDHGSIFIGSKIISSIGINCEETVSIEWELDIYAVIYVKVDPLNLIVEFNEKNNIAFKLFGEEVTSLDELMNTPDGEPILYTTDTNGSLKRVFTPDETIKFHIIFRNPTAKYISGDVYLKIINTSTNLPVKIFNNGESIKISLKPNSIKHIYATWVAGNKAKWTSTGFHFEGLKFNFTIESATGIYSDEYGFYVDRYGLPEWVRNINWADVPSQFSNIISTSNTVDEIKLKFNQLLDEVSNYGLNTIFISAEYYNYGAGEGIPQPQNLFLGHWFPANCDGTGHYSTPPDKLIETAGGIENARDVIRELVDLAHNHDPKIRVMVYTDVMGIYDPTSQWMNVDPDAKAHPHSTEEKWAAMDNILGIKIPKRLNWIELSPYFFAVRPCYVGPSKTGPAYNDNGFNPEYVSNDYDIDSPTWDSDPSYHYHIVKQYNYLVNRYDFDIIFTDDTGRLVQIGLQQALQGMKSPVQPSSSGNGIDYSDTANAVKDALGIAESQKDDFEKDSLSNLLKHLRDQIKSVNNSKAFMTGNYYIPSEVQWYSVASTNDLDNSDQHNIVGPFYDSKYFAKWAFENHEMNYKPLRTDYIRTLMFFGWMKFFSIPFTPDWFMPDELRTIITGVSWANNVKISGDFNWIKNYHTLGKSYKMRQTIESSTGILCKVFKDEESHQLLHHSHMPYEYTKFHDSDEISVTINDDWKKHHFTLYNDPYFVLWSIPNEIGEEGRILYAINQRVLNVSSVSQKDIFPASYTFKMRIPVQEKIDKIWVISPDFDESLGYCKLITDYSVDSQNYVHIKLTDVKTFDIVYISLVKKDDVETLPELCISSGGLEKNDYEPLQSKNSDNQTASINFFKKLPDNTIQAYTVKNLQPVHDEENAPVSIKITPEDKLLDVTLYWKDTSDLDLHIYTPYGEHIGYNYFNDTIDTIPNSSYDFTDKHEKIVLENPEKGNWTINVFGRNVDPDYNDTGVGYIIDVNAYGNYFPELSMEIDNLTYIYSGETFVFPIKLKNYGEGISYNTTIHFISQNINFSPNILNIGLLNPNKTLYISTEGIPLHVGLADIYINATYFDNFGNMYNTNISTTVCIQTKPLITAIERIQPQVSLNTLDNITFSTNITNIGTASASNVSYSIFARNDTITIKIFNGTIKEMGSNDSITSNVTTTLPPGDWYSWTIVYYEDLSGKEYNAFSNFVYCPVSLPRIFNDLDSDGIEEYAVDSDSNGIYDTYTDPNENTTVVLEHDFNADSMVDFLIDVDNDTLPDIFYDPNNYLFTNIHHGHIKSENFTQFLLAIDKNIGFDIYYDPSINITTVVKICDPYFFTYYIDLDGDALFDVCYDPATGIATQLDITLPTTFKSIGYPQYANGTWVTSFTPFNLTAFDNISGVNATYYRIWYNGMWSNWTTYTGEFTLSGECKHYLEFYSVDNAGNVENVTNQTHYVDDSPPVTSLSYGSPYYTNGIEEWITTSTPITLTAVDEPECAVGVMATYYSINGGNWSLYTQPFTINEECEHTIEWYSIDYLGNVEQIHSTVVNVDSSPPVTSLSYGSP